MSAYLYIAKMRILTSLAYRFEVFASMGANLIMLLATTFLWNAAYSGIGSVAGIDRGQMITYAVLSVLLGSVYVSNVQNIINQRVREGDIAVDFIKPVNIFGIYLAEDIGEAASAIANKLLPLLIIASIFIKPPLPHSVQSFFLFILSCVLGFTILWLLSALTGLTAFWIMELGNMGIVKDAIVKILSGSLIPIWFFPSYIQSILKFLPFQYTYQTPIGIYIGKIQPIEALSHMAIQVLWIIILFILFYFILKKARKMTLVQGG